MTVINDVLIGTAVTRVNKFTMVFELKNSSIGLYTMIDFTCYQFDIHLIFQHFEHLLRPKRLSSELFNNLSYLGWFSGWTVMKVRLFIIYLNTVPMTKLFLVEVGRFRIEVRGLN